ncbi:MAG: YhcH/YjgK/YiaL family protein [Proteobacteria bacterium]|nr:YhcH/YjgK/YiaL family protein [Pseudomonadota bacterium]
MILDILVNADCYLPLNKGFEKAFEFLKRPDLKQLPVGKYVIDHDHVFATIAKDNGRMKENSKLETHEKYIDIQLLLDGIDDMGWRPKSSCHQPCTTYDLESDIQFFTDEPDAWITTKPGAFVIFFPEDAHMPMISKGSIHKVVVKISVGPSS